MSAEQPPAYPSRQDLHALAAPGTVVPVVRELEVDGLDPLAVFALLSEGEAYAALLETSEAATGDADFSVVVPRAAAVLTGSDVLDQVRALMRDSVANVGIELPRFVGGVVGMLGHEHVCTIEPRVGVATGSPSIETPDACFLVVDELVAFDHRARRVLAIRVIDVDATTDIEAGYDDALRRLDSIQRRLHAPAPPVATRSLVAPEVDDPFECVRSNLAPGEYEDMVVRAREHVLSGECVQIVLSQRFDRPFTADPLLAYRAMRAVGPAPYHALLRLDDVHVVGASPEQLVGVAGDETVSTHPIAGTRPRGATDRLDRMLERELLADPKERAEHMMLVDLGRNDVGRVSVPGSVRVPRLCEIERFSHVMHLVSLVEGDLRPGLHPVDALRAAFPAGTLTGAPKIRAMELISRLEADRRGAYGGVVGYVGHGRTMELAITIRTAVIADGIASVQAGAGIVAASDPATEEAETRHKALGVLSALALAQRLQPAAETLHVGGAA